MMKHMRPLCATTAGVTWRILSETTFSPEEHRICGEIVPLTGEAAIMECMERIGPMYCSYNVYTDFSTYDTWTIYDGPASDADYRGGHAVTDINVDAFPVAAANEKICAKVLNFMHMYIS